MVILVVFNSFNVVNNLKKPDPVARQMPPFYTTGVQSALIESINKSTVSEFRMPRPTMEPQQNQPMPTFNLQNQHERQNSHQCYRFRQHLQTNLNLEQGEEHNEQS